MVRCERRTEPVYFFEEEGGARKPRGWGIFLQQGRLNMPNRSKQERAIGPTFY